MELPSHPETEETGPNQEAATTASRSSKLVIAVVAVLLAVIVILHLTGVVGPTAR